MKAKGTIGLLVFIGCIWAVALFTYGAQVRQGGESDPALQDMQNASCSSSSSSSSGQ